MIDLVIYGQFSAYDPHYLAKLNCIWRGRVRQIEKNHFPRKCQCRVCRRHFLCGGIDELLKRGNVCWGCDLNNRVEIAAETLFHLISAIPTAERDRLEIYPGDFVRARITPPPWSWRTPYGLKDYSEPTKLLNKFGEYEFAYRQKAASLVRFGGDNCAAIGLLGQLKPPNEQWALKSAVRLYLAGCYWRRWPSREEKRALFDRCQSLSWQNARLWKPGQYSIELEPDHLVRLEAQNRAALRAADDGPFTSGA